MASAGLDPKSVLASAPPGYRLAIPDADCDIGRFIAEKNAGVQAAAAGQFEQASRHLQNALAEWRGAVLEDLRDFQFVDPLSPPRWSRTRSSRTPPTRRPRSLATAPMP